MNDSDTRPATYVPAKAVRICMHISYLCTTLVLRSSWGQEGDEGFEFLWFAESDLDFAAASEALYPDRQFDGVVDEA